MVVRFNCQSFTTRQVTEASYKHFVYESGAFLRQRRSRASATDSFYADLCFDVELSITY